MPRPLRVQVEGALYLVTCRAMAQDLLFQDRRDYESYLDLLKEYRERFGFKLFAYALMPDSIHLMLEPADGTTVSAIMHDLNSRYTKYYGKRYGHSGHLFQQRFRSTVVEKGPQLLPLTGWLHMAPVRAGLGEDPGVCAWTSCGSYVEKRTSFLDVRREAEEVLEILRSRTGGSDYLSYMRSVPAAEWERMERELRTPAVGSEEFLALVAKKVHKGAAPQGTPAAVDPQPILRPAANHPSRGVALALAASLAVAFVTVGIAGVQAGLYAKSADSLKKLADAGAQAAASAARPMQVIVNSHAAQPVGFNAPVRLEGTLWDVRIQPRTGAAAGSVQVDQLQFEKNRLFSSRFSEQGFGESNYTLTPMPDGTYRWETMQSNPTGEILFWSGSWDGKRMHGVLTRQVPGSASQDFSFVGTPKLIEGLQRAEETVA